MSSLDTTPTHGPFAWSVVSRQRSLKFKDRDGQQLCFILLRLTALVVLSTCVDLPDGFRSWHGLARPMGWPVLLEEFAEPLWACALAAIIMLVGSF